jgi:NADH-quinone oxidoreductase subunit E
VSVRRLHPVQPDSFAFNAENMSWAKQTIAKYPPGKQASAVIPLLWRAQEQNDNWVSKPVIEYVADMLDMSYIRVLEVATFYTMFQLQPVGKVAHIQVCGTTPCMLRGAEELKKVCQNRIHHEQHHISEDGKFSWEEVECLGACVNAPMVQIFKDTYEDLTPESFEKLIDDLTAGRKVKVGPQIDRHMAAPMGGPTTLVEPSLYDGNRSFTRVEAPPPPPAAPAAAGSPSGVTVPAGTPAPAPAPPKPEETRPPTPASVAVDAQRAAAEKKEQAAGAVMEGKARTETNVTRATPEGVKETLGVASVADVKPELHTQPRGGKADDLELIWGVGPRLREMLNAMGVWHFDQIASWTEKEIAWVDARLEGFKGRIHRDDWIGQAKKLAGGWRPENAIGDKPKT